MKRIVYYLPILVWCLLASACSESDGTTTYQQVEIESSDVIFNADGGTGEIKLITPNVTATSSESWCVVTTREDQTVVATVQENISLQDRNAVIDLVTPSGMFNRVPVTQYGIRARLEDRTQLISGIGDPTRFAYHCDFILEPKTNSADWLTVTVVGDSIICTPQLNLTDNSRTATVVFVPRGYTEPEFTFEFTQDAGAYVKFADDEIRALANGEEIRYAFESNYEMEVLSDDADWLTAKVVSSQLVLSAEENTSTLKARTATVTLVPKGHRLPKIVVNVTQNKARPVYTLPLKYTDFLGEYELAFTTTYNGTTRPNTTKVELVEGADPNTYYLKGLLLDETIGNIVLKYVPEEGGITIGAQKISTGIPGDTSKDAWIMMYYSSGNTYSNSSKNLLISDEYDIQNGFVFNMKHYTSSSSTVVIGGFTLRTYPTGTTSGSSSWAAGAANGMNNYCYMQWKKLE